MISREFFDAWFSYLIETRSWKLSEQTVEMIWIEVADKLDEKGFGDLCHKAAGGDSPMNPSMFLSECRQQRRALLTTAKPIAALPAGKTDPDLDSDARLKFCKFMALRKQLMLQIKADESGEIAKRLESLWSEVLAAPLTEQERQKYGAVQNPVAGVAL